MPIIPKYFKIGGIVIALISNPDEGVYLLEPSYPNFEIQADPGNAADIQLTAKFGKIPELAGWELIFESGGVWKLYHKGNEQAIAFYSPVFGQKPYQLTCCDQDYTQGEVITSSEVYPLNHLPFPLRYPLAEILMINLLSQRQGLLLHACAISHQGRGYLFSGMSGAGKSTLTGLWQAEPEVEVLSDDRVILRIEDGQVNIYGTPWHGSAQVASPARAALAHIFIIKHAARNQLTPLSARQAFTSLLVRSFPPYWNAGSMAQATQTLSQVSLSTESHELGFVPDPTVVTWIKDSYFNR